jgi:SAM-dependent methyltransferase
VARLVCVDTSTAMLALAEAKLAPATEYVVADLLEYVSSGDRDLDVVVSSYAIHHLTSDEKSALFHGLGRRLRPGGRFAAGDLMLADRAASATVAAEVTPEVITELLDEEFPWFVDEADRALAGAGFVEVGWQRFSALSWAVRARVA